MTHRPNAFQNSFVAEVGVNLARTDFPYCVIQAINITRVVELVLDLHILISILAALFSPRPRRTSVPCFE